MFARIRGARKASSPREAGAHAMRVSRPTRTTPGIIEVVAPLRVTKAEVCTTSRKRRSIEIFGASDVDALPNRDWEKSCEIFASITIVGHAPSARHYLRPVRDLRSPGGGRNGLGVPGARPATRSRRRAQSHLRRDRARSVDAIAIRTGSESDRGPLASEHRLDFRFLEGP